MNRIGTVNRWNRVQNRTGGTRTVLPSPNKLIGKAVIAFGAQWKKQIYANTGFFILNCLHWQFQETLVFRVQLSPLFDSRCSWNHLRDAIMKPLAGSNLYLLFRRRKKSKYQCRMFQTPNPTEPKSTRNRRNRNRTWTEPGLETETEPKPHWIKVHPTMIKRLLGTVGQSYETSGFGVFPQWFKEICVRSPVLTQVGTTMSKVQNLQMFDPCLTHPRVWRCGIWAPVVAIFGLQMMMIHGVFDGFWEPGCQTNHDKPTCPFDSNIWNGS